MLQSSDSERILGLRYALCIGIGTYTELANYNLRYAVADADAIAEKLGDPQRGDFAVTRLTKPEQTTKAALDEAIERLLGAPDRQSEDLVLLYFSCHGGVNPADNTFCLWPSNATQKDNGTFEQTTLIGIHEIARWFANARTHNVVLLLDVCHSGGAGIALQHFKLNLDAGPNYFIIGAARQDRAAYQSSQLEHGLFTHCLLRAFGQPPTKDGWLTISQIQNFVSEEIRCFPTNNHPTQIQGSLVYVNPQLPLLRNPGYPELYPLPPLWNVPLQRNLFFTGREDLLVQLASMLQSEQKTALTQPYAVDGLGGIGKTQLALEYAYRYRQNYHAIFWGRADSRENLISTFVNIAYLLDLPEKDEKNQTATVEAVKAWLAAHSKWLLILDDADELALVKEFIPPALRGHLLLTTRAQVMGALAHKVEVGTMGPDVGALLLLRRAGQIAPDAPLEQASPADVTIAEELSEEMGGLPLALDQAGAYIAEVSCSLQDYRQLYQIHRIKLLQERGGVMPDHPESVVTTWSLAFQRVEQGNQAASDLLRLCAFLHPDAIPEEMITKGVEHLGPQLQAITNDPLALNKAIRALRAYSLLRRDNATHTLTIHRLVQVVLKEHMNGQTQREWAERTVRVVNQTFPSIEHTAWPQCQQYLPHARVCAILIDEWNIESLDAVRLLTKTGLYLENRGQYAEAEPLLRHALNINERVHGASHLEVARSLRDLAGLYRHQFKGDQQAEPRLQRAYAIYEKVLDPEHPDALFCLLDLASLYEDLRKPKQAEQYYQRVLAIFEKVHGPDAPEMIDTLLKLAHFYERVNFKQAEQCYQRVLTIFEKVHGPDAPEMINTLLKLAHFYNREKHNFEQAEQAEQCYQRVLAIFVRTYGPDHPNVAFGLDHLAVFYTFRRKYRQAKQYYQRALAIRERAYGPDHLDVAEGLDYFADFYCLQDKFKQAELLFQRALAIRERTYGPDHLDVAESLDHAAKIYMLWGKYPQAEQCYQRALAIRERTYGPDHPLRTKDLNNLAKTHYHQRKFEQAELLFQRALTIFERAYGPEAPEMAMTLDEMAEFYIYQLKYKQAEECWKRALMIEEKTLGADHPNTRETFDKLWGFYQGNYHYYDRPGLKAFLEWLLAERKRIYGPRHPSVALSRYYLKLYYDKYGADEQYR